jgi:hypothetical protein
MIEFPNTEFSDWTDGLKILQSVTRNLGKTSPDNCKSYAQWRSWNTKVGYACEDVRKLIKAVKQAYQTQTAQEEYEQPRTQFSNWIGSTGSNPQYVEVGRKEINGKEQVIIGVFQTLESLVDYQDNLNPVNKQQPLPLNNNQDYALKCQLDALERRVRLLEKNGHSGFNMDQFRSGV